MSIWFINLLLLHPFIALNFKQFDGSIVETHSSEVSLIGTIMANIEQAELTKHSVRALSLSETADQQSLQ